MLKLMPLLLIIIMPITFSSRDVLSKGMIYKCKAPDGETIYKKSPCLEEKQTVSKWKEPEREPKQMSLRQEKNGHYQLSGEINNTAIMFLVDTGATGVALPESVAKSANIDCNNKQLVATTANGPTSGCIVNVPTLKFGPFQVKDIKAIVLPNLSEALLGMNVLEQFNIQQDHGQLRIIEH